MQKINTRRKFLICRKCKTKLAISKFKADVRTITGYSSWCKQCIKDYTKVFLLEHDLKPLIPVDIKDKPP